MQMEKGAFSRLKQNHYGAIVIDCPWAFRTRGKQGDAVPQRAPEQHYKTMKRADLVALPVGRLAHDDCALFMWTFGAFYKQAIALGEAWGFTYKTDVFHWRKLTRLHNEHVSLGFWSRKQIETVLLFTRGRPQRHSKAVRQLITAPIREHSQKPDEIYERVEALVGGPYLEMFARTKRIGWSRWGDDVHRFGFSGGKAGKGKLKP